MPSSTQNYSEIKAYFEKNNVQKLIDDAINSIVSSKPHNCMGLLVKQLSEHEHDPTITRFVVQKKVIDQSGTQRQCLCIYGRFRDGPEDVLDYLQLLDSSVNHVKELSGTIDTNSCVDKTAFDELLRSLLAPSKLYKLLFSLLYHRICARVQTPFCNFGYPRKGKSRLEIVALKGNSQCNFQDIRLLITEKPQLEHLELLSQLHETMMSILNSKVSSLATTQSKEQPKGKEKGSPKKEKAEMNIILANDSGVMQLPNNVTLESATVVGWIQEAVTKTRCNNFCSVQVGNDNDRVLKINDFETVSDLSNQIKSVPLVDISNNSVIDTVILAQYFISMPIEALIIAPPMKSLNGQIAYEYFCVYF